MRILRSHFFCSLLRAPAARAALPLLRLWFAFRVPAAVVSVVHHGVANGGGDADVDAETSELLHAIRIALI